ncbi:MAG: hypothetical protein R2911_38105 [Caldilineaceae bacterium]
MGYLVAPSSLTAAFKQAMQHAHRYLSVVDQAVLADFIHQGHFARHIRRMRALYLNAKSVLIDAIRRELAPTLTVDPAPAGLHLVGWLKSGLDDREVTAAAAQQGIEVAPISGYSLRPEAKQGLVLGYAMLNEAEIVNGVQGLRRALAQI